MTILLYSDGGIIGRNPSTLGGTWAFCKIQSGKMLDSKSGVVTPLENKVEKITNNFTELFAATKALLTIDKEYPTTIFVDSAITLHRLTTSQRFAGIPNWLRLLTLDLRRNRRWKVELVAGHPTREELKNGFTANGSPVSKWNQWCDLECKRLAREFMENLK